LEHLISFSINESFFPSDKEKKRPFHKWVILFTSLMLFYLLTDISSWKAPTLIYAIQMYFLYNHYKNFNQTYVKSIVINTTNKLLEIQYQHHFDKEATKYISFENFQYSIGHSSKTYKFGLVAKKVLEFYENNEFLANIRLENDKNGWEKEDLNNLVNLLNSLDEIDQILPEHPDHL